MSVLAVCPADWAGVRKSITQDADAYADLQSAEAAIRAQRPAEVRFGGYDRKWRRLVKFAKSRQCRVVVTIHHTPLFHEFAPSGRTAVVEAIRDLRRGLIDRFETPDEGVAGTLNAFGVPCELRRSTLDEPACAAAPIERQGLHIGIFGTGLPWKNQETQMLAAALAIREAAGGTIHMQSIRDGSLMQSLGIQYEIHAQMERERFYGLLASMTLNMAVGVTETFGYTAVESFLLGVPSLFSPMTPAFYEVETSSPVWSCRVDRIDDPPYIAAKIREVVANRAAIVEAGREFCRRHLKPRQSATNRVPA